MGNGVNVNEMPFCSGESFFFVAYRVEKGHNKVHTLCCHIFVAYRGEKCDKSKY